MSFDLFVRRCAESLVLLSAAVLLVLPAQASASRRLLLGRSLQGRPIWAVETGDRKSRVKAAVIGCIDGNETAGIAIARALESQAGTASGVDLWVIEDMNPDGVAAGTLQNADRVDLNRNFPWKWRPLGRPGNWQYSGPKPLSEPESRAVYRFLRRLRPRLVVWYHQPLDVVDESGGSVTVEHRYATMVGLPITRLPRYPGSAASWVDHLVPHSTSFVVELEPGPMPPRQVSRHVRAILRIAREVAQSTR